MTDTICLTAKLRFTLIRWTNKKRSTVIPPLGTFIYVIELPWYKCWFGRKPVRHILADGIHTVKQLKFV